jgi:CheY-like chemotaxis protein
MKKILMVEDDKIVARIYQNKLAVEGFEVAVAENGEIALQHLKTNQPDLVLLDLGLPKINGIEVLLSIRAHPETATVPVIVFTNAYLSKMVEAAWKAGATKCVTKAACTPRQLVEIIHHTLMPTGAASSPAGVPAQLTPGSFPASEPAKIPGASASGSMGNFFQSQVRESFLKNGPSFVAGLRHHVQALARGVSRTPEPAELEACYHALHTLTGNAAIAGVSAIAQLSAALEALVKDLCDKPKSIGSSPLRTIACAVDSLDRLFDSVSSFMSDEKPLLPILVVDDDSVSRRAIGLALGKVNLSAITLEDPALALKLLEENAFALIFSDLEMPVMDGLEFCARARTMSRHAATPFIFVTSHSDFDRRAQSKLKGATDLIGKPFLPIELGVKALTYALTRSAGTGFATALPPRPRRIYECTNC